MIIVNAAPFENRVLLDANNTVISVTSTNGVGFYFRAEISINDIIFDTQGWSRRNEFTAEKDLKKTYSTYFQSIFSEVFENGIINKNEIKRKVSIKIIEYSIENDVEVQSLELDDFYIIYNQNPTAFDDQAKIQFLGVEPEVLLIPENGKIILPFMVNAENEAVSVTLKNNFGTELNAVALPSLNGNHIFSYQFDLNSLVLINNTIFFIVRINVGSFYVEKSIRLLRLPSYPIKEILYQNNFGFWCCAYFDGQLTVGSGLDIETFERFDGSEEVFEINEILTYTINSGSFLNSEKKIIREVSNARKSKMKINGIWADLIAGTKKLVLEKDRLHNYSENLVFTLKPNSSVKNLGVGTIPEVLGISISSSWSGGSVLRISFSFLTIPYELELLLVISKDGIDQVFVKSTGNEEDLPLISHSIASLPPGTYSYKLKSILNPGKVSNTLTFIR